MSLKRLRIGVSVVNMKDQEVILLIVLGFAIGVALAFLIIKAAGL